MQANPQPVERAAPGRHFPTRALIGRTAPADHPHPAMVSFPVRRCADAEDPARPVRQPASAGGRRRPALGRPCAAARHRGDAGRGDARRRDLPCRASARPCRPRCATSSTSPTTRRRASPSSLVRRRQRSTDLFSFTSRINDAFEMPQKLRMIEHMWRVAYADGQLERARAPRDVAHRRPAARAARRLRACPDAGAEGGRRGLNPSKENDRCPSSGWPASGSRPTASAPGPTRVSRIRSASGDRRCTSGCSRPARSRRCSAARAARPASTTSSPPRGFANVGAWILGRNMFGPVRGPWPDDTWKGWWGRARRTTCRSSC